MFKMSHTSENAVIIKDLYKTFKLPHEQHSGIKQAAINVFNSNKGYESQKVLSNISFDIKKGDFFGIVGRNGSGKSTLLKLLAGIYAPDSGLIQVNGTLTPFIELGVGFNPELTGRENVYLNGALLGFDHKQMQAMYSDIVEFAELDKFMDQKLKNYSSGMQVRLAFSIAIRAKSDILLLDEVLAVGDAIFQKKCFDYFKQLKREGRTVIFVSHDTGALQEYCTNGILLEKGKIIKSGRIDTIVKDYLDILNETEKQHVEEDDKTERRGSGEVLVESIKIGSTKDRTKIFKDDEPITLDVIFRAQQDVDKPVYGVTITDLTGQIVFQSNTLWRNIPVKNLKRGESISLKLQIPNAFNTGTYLVSPAVSDKGGVGVYDWREDMTRFKTTKTQKSHAVVNIDHKISVE
jgi:ABC-2 type transport system ATP-binding protein